MSCSMYIVLYVSMYIDYWSRSSTLIKKLSCLSEQEVLNCSFLKVWQWVQTHRGAHWAKTYSLKKKNLYTKLISMHSIDQNLKKQNKTVLPLRAGSSRLCIFESVTMSANSSSCTLSLKRVRPLIICREGRMIRVTSTWEMST